MNLGLGRTLVIAGFVLIVVGGAVMLGDRLPFKLGRLPGDIFYQGKHGSFYFPLVTCLLVSAVLSFVLWLVNRR